MMPNVQYMRAAICYTLYTPFECEVNIQRLK